LRSFCGYLGDKTGKYWLVTIVGYIVNMLAVPALALAGNWPLAAGLIVAERTGRAIRKPSTDAMLSFAGHKLGRGWVFGLNEAFDQAGATLSPHHFSGTIPARQLSNRFRATPSLRATYYRDCFRR